MKQSKFQDRSSTHQLRFKADIGQTQSSGETLGTIATNHVRSFWPDRKVDSLVWTAGPAQKTMPDLTVSRVSPAKPGDYWIYVSSGCSRLQLMGGMRREFTLLSPHEDPTHVETIAMVAFYLLTFPEKSEPGSVINIGRSWTKGSDLSNLLVSLPYPFGPAFEWCSTTTEPIQYLWLLPVTDREKAFLETNGAAELEQKFDEEQINFLDPYRLSVV